MNSQRTMDRAWGLALGVPMVALPVRIAQWSPWMAVLATVFFLALGLGYIFGITPIWFIDYYNKKTQPAEPKV